MRDVEQFEGSPLQCGGAGDLGECRYVLGGLDLVGADGGQVGEQAGEAVHGVVIVGAFARGLLKRWVGALCGGDGVSAFGGGGFVVVDKQDWRESLFHVPADDVGQHAQEHVGAYSIDQPVANRGHIKFAVEGAEESLDVGEVFVAAQLTESQDTSRHPQDIGRVRELCQTLSIRPGLHSSYRPRPEFPRCVHPALAADDGTRSLSART